MNISIVSGWLPMVVCGLAVVAVALAVDWTASRWRRQLVIGISVAVVGAGLVALVCSIASLVPTDFPWAAYLWLAAFILAVCLVVLGWRTNGRLRRTASVVAVVFTLVVTVGTVNQRADAFPTVDRLLADQPEHVVETPELTQIQKQVAATGQLPDKGAVIEVTIPPTVSHFATRKAFVYLPPAWFAKVTPTLPTLVLLPGEPGSASDWSNLGDADTTADDFAHAHHGLAPIIVMPDPDGLATVDSECVNSQFGNAETYLVVDVPAFVRSRFDASTAPGSLAIGGLSAGGTCSTMLALIHPGVYPTFASYSGFASPQYQDTTRSKTIDTLFGGSKAAFDAHDPVQMLRSGHYNGVAGWFEVGDQDSAPLRAAQTLQPAALRAGISTCILVRPGGHDYDVWIQALRDSFPWLAWRLGLISEPSSEPATCNSP